MNQPNSPSPRIIPLKPGGSQGIDQINSIAQGGRQQAKDGHIHGVGAATGVSTAKMRRGERAFLPAALEVIETPLSPTLRATSAAICSLVAIALAWSYLARIDMVAIASGKIVPLGQVKVVQPLETSAIRGIHVDDGDHVKAGEALVDLDPTDIVADLSALKYDRGQAALDAELARVLIDQASDSQFILPEGVIPALGVASRMQAQSELSRYRAQLAGVEAGIAQKQAELEANTAAILRAEATLPLLQEKNVTAQGLFDKKYGARAPVLDSKQLVLEKQAELDTAKATTRQIEAQINVDRAKLDELNSNFLADASDRRAKALQKLADLDQQMAKSQQRERYRQLVSPVDGVVQNVKIHTPGAVVTTADTLMTIVPDDTGLEIQASVENKDIGFVHEGQEVEIKVDAFPFTRYGLIKGHVRRIGHDAAPLNAPGQTASSAAQPPGDPSALLYPAKIAITQDWIGVDDRRERLQSGMSVSAEIKTGTRRVIEYLLSPVIQAVSEAGRER